MKREDVGSDWASTSSSGSKSTWGLPQRSFEEMTESKLVTEPKDGGDFCDRLVGGYQ
jgi:hypothetical protein